MSVTNSLKHNEVISIQNQINQVEEYLRRYDGVLVAFSGGVDSSTLAALAYRSLGERAAAVTARSQTLPSRELENSRKTAQEIGIRHIVISYDELDEDGFAANTVDRCYFCKSGLFFRLTALAAKMGFEAVADGTNASELEGHRPGHRAAIEYGILTPFSDLGITKEEIRRMARHLGLSVWDKPQQACLSSRFPYGSTITPQGLRRVERAEDMLVGLGVRQYRVRDHGDIARIEVAESDFSTIMENKAAIIACIKKLGYTFVTLDLEGFKSGSFDKN